MQDSLFSSYSSLDSMLRNKLDMNRNAESPVDVRRMAIHWRRGLDPLVEEDLRSWSTRVCRCCPEIPRISELVVSLRLVHLGCSRS